MSLFATNPVPLQRVKSSKERAQALSRRALEVLEALTDAVPDPSNIHPSMLASIQRFDEYVVFHARFFYFLFPNLPVSVLHEACQAMVPLTQRRRWVSSVFSLNRNEVTLELFSRRLDESFQTFTVRFLLFVLSSLLISRLDWGSDSNGDSAAGDQS
jgi:hypothetical protein